MDGDGYFLSSEMLELMIRQGKQVQNKYPSEEIDAILHSLFSVRQGEYRDRFGNVLRYG